MTEKTSRKISVPKDSVVGGTIQTNDVDSFVGMLQESNTARKEMKTALHEILRQPDTLEEIRQIINKTDRDAVKAFWSKFGFAVWSGLIYVLGVVTTLIIQKLM